MKICAYFFSSSSGCWDYYKFCDILPIECWKRCLGFMLPPDSINWQLIHQGSNLTKLFRCKLTNSFVFPRSFHNTDKFIWHEWSSSQESWSKFMPKMFYVIDHQFHPKWKTIIYFYTFIWRRLIPFGQKSFGQ